MKTLDNALLQIGLAIWASFAFLIAIETGFVSARLRGDGIAFRWQAWLLAAIFVMALRDLLVAAPCSECRERKVPTMRELFTMGDVVCQGCRQRRDRSPGEGKAIAMTDEGAGTLL